MGKTEEDWSGLKFGFLKTVQPNSFSKLIPAACNFINNAQETYLFVSDLWYLSFTCNFCAYFKCHSDWGRTELDCHDTAPLSPSVRIFEIQQRDGNDNVAWKINLCYFSLYYIHFEITEYPCNLIGSQQCDLFLNRTIFCSKSHLFQIASFMF